MRVINDEMKREGETAYEVTMTSYLFALLVKHKVQLVLALIIASMAIVYTHKPTKVVARSLVSFHPVSSLETATIEDKKLPEKENYVTFLRSYDFFRAVAEEIIQNESYQKIRKSLASSNSKSSQDEVNTLAESLKKMATFTEASDNRIQIEVEGHGKISSSKIAKLISEVGVKQLLNHRLVNYHAMKESANNQISEIQKEFEVLNSDIINYKNKHNLLSTQTIPDDLRNSLTNLTKARIEAEIQLKETNYMISNVSERLAVQKELIKSTQGLSVTYSDQVMENRLQELQETKSSLEGKISGLNKVIAQESKKYNFIAAGEEKLNFLSSKRNTRLEQLNQLELKLKQIETMGDQIKQSFRVVGDPYIVQIQKSMNLGAKLAFANFAVLFIVMMAIFYWYEFFPVLSSLQLENTHAETVPWFGNRWRQWPLPHVSNESVRNRLKQITAQKILERLPRAGLYQVVSNGKGEGKSYLVSLLSQELIKRNQKVAIIALDPKASYSDLPSGVKVHIIQDAKKLETFVEEAKNLKFSEDADDWIFVDSGSLTTNVDHLLVSPYMDGIILVGSYLETRKERYIEWQRKIEHIAGKKSVFVLNKTNLSSDLPFLLVVPQASSTTVIRKVS